MLPDFHNAVTEAKSPKENLVYWYYDFWKLWGVCKVFHTLSCDFTTYPSHAPHFSGQLCAL